MMFVNIPSLLLWVGTGSASLFSRTPTQHSTDIVILPKDVHPPQNVPVRGNGLSEPQNQADIAPSVTIVSVYNETRGSGFHPFACWDHPDFFSGQHKKWAAGTKQRFELDCWTNPVFQTQISKGSRTPWTFAALAFDNDIIWFSSPREKCWFPDFVVQKDAQYGPSLGNLGIGSTTTSAASAKGAQSTSKQWGPPWLRGAGGGGPPWTWWANFVGSSTGPTTGDDLRLKLRYCPTPVHQVGGFREQYNAQTYCYKCTRLDCDNKPISLGSVDANLELACYTSGNKVESDAIWWKLRAGDECYIPNQVFDPTRFLGNAGECSKK